MRWHIFAVGKPKLEFARLGAEEYAARIKPFALIELHYVKAQGQAEESQVLLERSKGMYRIVLDERGEHVDSRTLARKLSTLETSGKRDMAVLIGGADGHSEEVRQAAIWCWSLSKLTLQHECALVIGLEQIYRAHTIKAGLPYHRD